MSRYIDVVVLCFDFKTIFQCLFRIVGTDNARFNVFARVCKLLRVNFLLWISKVLAEKNSGGDCCLIPLLIEVYILW